MIAGQGVAVAMVEFRNCVTPSALPEVAPFPAGLNDCVSGVKWLAAHADELGIDAGRIIVAGESGGGNLTLATGLRLKQDGDLGLIQGLYALCPYIAGRWPLPENPSSTENNGLLLDLHNNQGAMGYGIEELEKGNPLAWPGFANEDDVRGMVSTIISVNECDPLRDEGVGFYRLLLRAGVSARCRQVMGTIHGTEIFPIACPDISRETALSIADFCHQVFGFGRSDLHALVVAHHRVQGEPRLPFPLEIRPQSLRRPFVEEGLGANPRARGTLELDGHFLHHRKEGLALQRGHHHEAAQDLGRRPLNRRVNRGDMVHVARPKGHKDAVDAVPRRLDFKAHIIINGKGTPQPSLKTNFRARLIGRRHRPTF